MRRLTKITTLMTASLLSLSAFSAIAASSSQLPAGARAGILIQKNNQITQQENADKFFPPASTLKVLTAAVAKIQLGDNFRFSTTIEQQGKNMVLRFTGDPSLTRADISRLFSLAKKKGVTRIQGDLILDTSVFTGYERGVGWPWDILGSCYSTPSSAVIIDGNCVYGSIYTNSSNGTTRAHVPANQPIRVSTTARTVSSSTRSQLNCDLELLSDSNNNYQLSGCLTPRKDPLPLKFAVQNPPLYATKVISQILTEQGISVAGRIRTGTAPQGKVVMTHRSNSLPVLLDHMLKRSDNLYANNIAKTVGRYYYKQPGSFTNGAKATKAILKSKGVNVDSAVLVDGSGLSRSNRMTPKQMLAVLNFVKRNDAQLKLIQLMPVSGTSGTLTYRKSMQKAPIKGRIVAKSGSIFGTYNMAGFTLDANGRPKNSFVEFVTDYHPTSGGTTALAEFERSLYSSAIN
ncbi:MAG: serine-type D-Ala-D-Ala carboxypeptidase [Vibrio sp.]